MKDYLEEAAEEYRRKTCNEACKNGFLDNHPSPSIKTAFIAGAKWQKSKDDMYVDTIYQQGIEKGKDDMKEQAVSGTLTYEPHLRRIIVNLEDIPDGVWNGGGTLVEVIICKKED